MLRCPTAHQRPGYRKQIANLDAQERQITRQLAELASQSGSTLGELRGLSTVSVAELLVEVGDLRRFTIGGFARFNGTAPLAASTAKICASEPESGRRNPADLHGQVAASSAAGSATLSRFRR